ncbi:maestro heat-like repeat-containing protein family member 2B isoform X3 [Hemicordylus capensis]|uniref:maestro heat-like repeat-containing protein family member 2B isoform X3 n=1 Tax=Hemicordylus capensis TaxID=884348 RepID=UPI002302989F|nr:maestro heat-like repeat-containing protein family member 2B isoform X3 [Hemicordylus capensis]
MDQLLDLKIRRDVYNSISLRLECLQNANHAADSILKTVGELNVKLAIGMLAEEMLKEQATERVRGQASAILLVLANKHFNDVMYELQKSVRTVVLPHKMVFRTLGDLASRYALKCIPFLSLTFVYIRLMLKLTMINQMKEEICYVMEHFSMAINYYYKNWKVCSFPREAESQLCGPVIPLYRHLVRDWLNEEEPKIKEASMKALWPMFGVLVRRREQQDEVIKNVPHLLVESKILDSFLVAKRLSLFLDVCEECKPSIPKKIFQEICDYVFQQVLPLSTSMQHLKKCQKIVERFTHQNKKAERQKSAGQRKPQEGEPTPWEKGGVCQPWYGYQEISWEHRDTLMDAFGHLVSCCPADALEFLQAQMKNDAEYMRVGILKHLKTIISSEGSCETKNRKRPIVEAVKCVLDDQRDTVRKAILGFIKELLRSPSVEGCAVWDMVVYVFEQFTLPASQAGKESSPTQKEQEKEKEEAIQQICIEVLEHLNTSAEGMSKALWPKLLYFVVPAPYTPTLTPLCRCLRELALIRQDEGALFLGSCKGVRLPSAQGLVARLLVLASKPNPRGNWALQLLHAVRGSIHAAVKILWGKQIPFLWESLFRGNPETSNQEWEQKLLQFLRRSLETIDDSSWTKNLSQELENQMASYSDQSAEKSFLYKSLGTSLTSCEDLTFVQSRMQHFVENTNYMDASEREKVIQILSFSAMGHLDLTLATLQEFGGGIHMKIKMSDIINRYKDYSQGRRGHTHQTLMLTYGQVALHAPKELLFSRVETDIMKRVLFHYRRSCQVLGVSIANKDLNLKLALIQSTTDVCRAIHGTRNCQDFLFTCKKELLSILLEFIREEPLDTLATPIRSKAITAIAFLSKLKPYLTMEEIRDLLDQCIKSLFPLPPLEQLKQNGEKEPNSLNVESLYVCSMDALGQLTRSIIEVHPTTELIDELFQLTDPWFTETECSRERALQASFQALTAFQENVCIPVGESYPQFGSLVAFLAPYTCDDSTRCRLWAAQCIICLMHVQAQSRVSAWEEEEMLSACKDLQEEVPRDLFRASSRMAKVVSAYFPAEQALDFIEAILEDLVSGNEMCAIAAGRWLLILLQDCGAAMKAQIPKILDIFYSHLPIIKQDDLRQVLVDAVCIVAHYHLDDVFSSLLCRRLPMDSETGELWRSLGREPSLASLVLHKLAATVRQPSAPEPASPSDSEETVEFAEEEPLKATCAIYEVISVLPYEDVVQELYPELFCALLQQVSKTLGQKMPFYEGRRRLFLRDHRVSEGNPCRLSVASLKTLLFKITCDPSLAEIGEVNIWALLRDPSAHQEGVCLLTKIIQEVLPWMKSSSEKLRLTATAFYTEVIWDPTLGEREPLKTILPILIERAGDQHPGTRQMAVRGLGNIILVAPDKPHRCFSCVSLQGKEQKKTIVAVLQGALYDAKVVLESLKVLALVLPHLKSRDVGFLFKDISMKTITYLDDDNADLRNAALHLFGILAAWTKFRYRSFFAEQVRKSLVLLLIHQQDPSPRVAETCRVAFLQSVRFLSKRKLRIHIEELHRTTNLNFPNLHVHVYRLLVCRGVVILNSRLVSIQVNTNPEIRDELLKKTVEYYQSPWEEIRRAAVELSGVILESMQVTDLQEPSHQHLLTSLEMLQDDPSPGVQQAAADVAASVFKKQGAEMLRRSEATPNESNPAEKPAPNSDPKPGTTQEVAAAQDLHE